MPEPDGFGDLDDAQLAELDFEHQSTQPPAEPAPELEPAAEDDSDAFWAELAERLSPEQMAAQEAAQQQGGPSDEDFWAQLEELAEIDPFKAANVMAEIRSQEIEARMQQQLAPIVQREANQQADEQVQALEAEFGQFFDQEGLSKMIEAKPEKFIREDGAIDGDALHQAAELLALRAGADYRAGGDITRGMDAVGQTERTDPFGASRGHAAAQGPGPQPRDAQGRFAAGQVQRTVHVEGGSSPAPAPAPRADPVVEEIDALAGDSDIFGNRPRSR